MTDQQLRRALRELPRHHASDGFMRRTLARLDESLEGAADEDTGRSAPAPALRSTLARVAAAAALVLAVVAGAMLVRVLERNPATTPSPSAPSASQAAASTPPAPAGDPGQLTADAQPPAAEPTLVRPAAGTVRSPQRQAELAALRAEHDRLADELRALRRQIRPESARSDGLSGSGGVGAAVLTAAGLHPEPTSGDPLLYLGGNDRVDLVLDLGRLAAERDDGSTIHRPEAPPGGSS